MSLKDKPINQRYSDGDVILTEGIISNNAYVVLKGSVRITKKLIEKWYRWEL
jgi:CRP/FNR family cyclic AMP-dependent transcriptional regulator